MNIQDWLPKGIIPDPSPEAGQLLSNATGRAVYNAVSRALTKYWMLHPVGSENVQQLTARIALLYAQQFADKWQGPIAPENADQGSHLTTLVNFVSPTSTPKSAYQILADEQAAGQLTNVWVAVGVAVLALGAYLVLRRKK